MARRRIYGWNDRYQPPDFQEGDRVHFRGGKNNFKGGGTGVLVWEVLAVSVTHNYSHGWIRVRSTRSKQTRLAWPKQLRMVQSAAERVANALMGEDQ